jgi:hypothetical protein
VHQLGLVCPSRGSFALCVRSKQERAAGEGEEEGLRWHVPQLGVSEARRPSLM